jgi:hypothetical protein
MEKQEWMQALEDFQKNHENPELKFYGYRHESWKSETDLKTFQGFYSEPWVIGGRTGGNPWGEADRDSDAEEPKEINLLDEFLEKYYPNITFLQYKRLMRLIKNLTWTNDEYYGNSSDYKCAYITFEDISEYLSKIKWI